MLRRAFFIALLALGVAACGDDDADDDDDDDDIVDAGADAGDDDDDDDDDDAGTPEDCTNGTDDDGDEDVDCDDSDCDAEPTCNPEADCADGEDNDEDGDTDCADSDCDGVDGCELDTELTCDDGEDNDADGDSDCADSDCAAEPNCVPEDDCADGEDNDVDGDTDCDDSDCAEAANCVPEVDCADDTDNDLDGDTDCADSDCAAAPNCNPEADCFDDTDNDLDGTTDCEDTDCALACALGCTPDRTIVAVSGADLPQPVGVPTATSVVNVAVDGVVTGVVVGVDITHVYVGDADIRLTGPDGLTTDVSINHGSSGDNYTDTIFSDYAATWIGDGTPPYTGAFQPDEYFGDTQAGGAADGTWELEVSDNYPSLDDGSLDSFDLYLCVCNGTAGCEFGLACRDGVSNDDDADVDCADADCAADPSCLPEADCADGLDDDFDGAIDCLDDDCDGVDGCEFGAELTCDDGDDNDADADTDCADGDCDGLAGCEFGTELTCDDGDDNDADGTIDCADADCATAANCLVESDCDDGADNDADGATDCTDADCDASAYCSAEADCNDGLDDDSDGVLDCLDPGCDGIDGCELGGEVSCADGIDNDSDGATDCADTQCASLLVCAITSCPAGTAKAVYTSTDVPKLIPDFDVGGSGVSTLTVADSGLIADIAVGFTINHTWAEDVDITFSAPGGDNELSTDNGGSGDNYINTRLTNSAAAVIGSAGNNTAPFTAIYRPEQAFDLAGAILEGDYVFTATDDEGGINGTITAYAILVCACETGGPNDCEFGQACSDGIDNDNDGSTDCEEAACATDVTCIPEPDCDDGLDNDLDGDVDCDDDDCDGFDGCEFGTELSCDDGFDNDGDGVLDCEDTDCDAAGPCLVESSCTNGIDDDGDGDTDCVDDECSATPICNVESDCNDTIDNDGDGQTDCAEPLCNGIDGCTFGYEENCNDAFDNDGDGLVDAAETVCSWVAAALPTCAAGQLHAFRATDTPITISATGTPTVNSFLAVASTGTVAGVAVRINIPHTYVSDLDITLFSPTGTSRELSTDNGGSGDNFTNTVFSDSGAAVIGSAGNNTAPFTGMYRPEQAFAPTLVGQTVVGSWNLRAFDQFNADGGTLNEFSLALCYE